MESGSAGEPLVWPLLALAFLPVLASWATIESWDLPGQLARLYDLSYQLPLARFLPPTALATAIWRLAAESTYPAVGAGARRSLRS